MTVDSFGLGSVEIRHSGSPLSDVVQYNGLDYLDTVGLKDVRYRIDIVVVVLVVVDTADATVHCSNDCSRVDCTRWSHCCEDT